MFRSTTVASLNVDDNTPDFFDFAVDFDNYNNTPEDATYVASTTDITTAIENGSVRFFKYKNGYLDIPSVVSEAEASDMLQSNSSLTSILTDISNKRIVNPKVAWRWYQTHLRNDMLETQETPFITPINFPFGFILLSYPDTAIPAEAKALRDRYLKVNYTDGPKEVFEEFLAANDRRIYAYNSGILFRVKIAIPDEIKFTHLETFMNDPRGAIIVDEKDATKEEERPAGDEEDEEGPSQTS
jgi:hypothetical protein